MVTRRQALALGLATASLATLRPAEGVAQQAYPDRPIRLVIPFPPGGVYDTVGRPLVEKLKPRLGNIVVENMGGAAGARGAGVVARAQPDGYTLMIGGTTEMVLVPLAAATRPYDPMQEFEPIARIGLVGICFAVHPGLPINSFKELIDYAKANPGKLSFGSPGAGSLPHLAGEMLKTVAEAPGIVHVPYAGAGPALNDVIGGHIQLGFVTMSAQVIELHRAGRIRLLAVATAERIAGAKEIPTTGEAGFPGVQATNFLGLFAPKGTPAEIVRQIAQATTATMADKDFTDTLTAGGFEPDRNSGPDHLRGFLQGELDRWGPVVKSSGFKLN